MKNAACFAIAVSVAVGLNTYPGEAQTTLNVNAGQTLTGADLIAGEFDGQTFTLGSDLTIEINDGGVLANLDDAVSGHTFNFNGATININTGGEYDGDFSETLAEVVLNIYSGGEASYLDLDSNAVVTVQGGLVYRLDYMEGGSTVTMSSGELSADISGDSTGLVTMTGGTLLRSSSVRNGGSLTISGGLIAEEFRAGAGNTTFVGSEFQLNGINVTHLDDGLSDNSVFTGTLSDGSVLILASVADAAGISDVISAGTVTLQQASLVPVDTSPIVVNTASDMRGLRQGQNLTLTDGGSLNQHFAAVGATVNITGGTVGSDFQTAYSQVTISGGQFGSSDDTLTDLVAIYDGSVVEISGGRFGDRLHALAGSTVDISGGRFDDGICAWSGSTVTLHGDDFQLNGSAVTQIDAGVSQTDLFTGTLSDGTVIILSGLEQWTVLNNYEGGGTTVNTTIQAYDPIAANTTTLSTGSLGVVDTTPQIVPSGVGPRGLRPGQTLTLSGTGQLEDNFGLVNATLNIEGGTVGDYLRVAHGDIQMSGGLVDGRVLVYDGGVFTMSGGEVAGYVSANYGGQVVISDGSVPKVNALQGGHVLVQDGTLGSLSSYGGSLEITGGQVTGSIGVDGGTMLLSGGTIETGVTVKNFFYDVPSYAEVTGGQMYSLRVDDDSTVDFYDGVVDLVATASGASVLNIHGGHFSNLRVESAGTINLYGGEVTGNIRSNLGGTINIWGGDILGKFNFFVMGGSANLYVQQLMLDGELVDLTLDEPYIITERDGILLNAILSDGSLLDITLNATPISGEDYFLPQSTLTVTLVPEPMSFGLLAAGVGVLCLRRRSMC